MDNSLILYLVVPCYNEEEALLKSATTLKNKINLLIEQDIIGKKSKIMFVNDGSSDNTFNIIHDLYKSDNIFIGLNLSRNFGHQSAILAGMMTAKEVSDIIITIDADLQQDVEAIDDFITAYKGGCDIVYGVRNNRNSDKLGKKLSANIFYSLIKFLSCNVIPNHADYRLMSKKALNALGTYKEVNLFLRGIIPLLGFKTDIVYFDVKERELGKTKYTLQKMIGLALNGITSLSIQPIRMITAIGILVLLFSLCMVVYSISMFFSGSTVPGWASTIAATWSIGGIMIFSLGIIGEYVGKIYMETKGRPQYIIDSILWDMDRL